jgi:hypothetical protein
MQFMLLSHRKRVHCCCSSHVLNNPSLATLLLASFTDYEETCSSSSPGALFLLSPLPCRGEFPLPASWITIHLVHRLCEARANEAFPSMEGTDGQTDIRRLCCSSDWQAVAVCYQGVTKVTQPTKYFAQWLSLSLSLSLSIPSWTSGSRVWTVEENSRCCVSCVVPLYW